jgi:hypothetical protein
MPSYFRGAQEYREWVEKCDRQREQWEKDMEEWKALYRSDTDSEDWASEFGSENGLSEDEGSDSPETEDRHPSLADKDFTEFL